MSRLKKLDFGNSVSAPDWVEQRLSNKQGQTSACQSRKTKGLSVSLILKSSIQILHPHSSSAYPALTSRPQTQHPPALKAPRVVLPWATLSFILCKEVISYECLLALYFSFHHAVFHSSWEQKQRWWNKNWERRVHVWLTHSHVSK